MAPERPPWQRVYVVATAAVIGATCAYALCDWAGWTRLQYDVYRDAWWWQDGPTQKVPINYYGDILWGAGGAAAGAAIGLVATGLHRRPLSPAIIALLGAWALTGAALSGLYYTWNLWPF